MATMTNRWAAVWDKLSGSPAEVKRSILIPPANVTGGGLAHDRFEAGNHYFAVQLNEMYLSTSRQWFSVYDPMAIVVTEFTYDGERKVVPVVVGPSMIQENIKRVPNGMAITDTLVAGIHPYQGGKFVLSVILAQVRRESYARRLLGVVDKMANAFVAGSALKPYLKASDAVLEGIEELFNMGETRPIAGHRWEYNDGISPWLKPGFFALIDADERTIARDKLLVQDGRLIDGSRTPVEPVRSEDFLLYSLQPLVQRNDVTELSFYRIFQSALRDAAHNEPGAWERAKAALVTLHQDLLTSPDLTWNQVQELMDAYEEKLTKAHDRAKSFGTLGPETDGVETSKDPEFGPFRAQAAEQRLARLSQIHKLLERD
jgi:hypothetical protein